MGSGICSEPGRAARTLAPPERKGSCIEGNGIMSEMWNVRGLFSSPFQVESAWVEGFCEGGVGRGEWPSPARGQRAGTVGRQ